MRCLVFFSGNGSTAEALLQYQNKAQYHIELLVSDNPLAAGIKHAHQFSTELLVIPWTLAENAHQWCEILKKRLAHYDFDLIVLAGFMRLLSADFIGSFENKIINIHPSLLPDLKGLHTHQRALDQGKKQHGFSIHLVTEELDSGPVLAQHTLNIEQSDTAYTLQQRVQQAERYWYPQVVQWIASGQLSWQGSHIYMNNTPVTQTGLTV